MSQHMYDISWLSPSGQAHQQQNYPSSSAALVGDTPSTSVGAVQPDLDMADFPSHLDLTGPGTFGAAAFNTNPFPSYAGTSPFFGASTSNTSIFPASAFSSWSQSPVPSSSYSTLNGAISTSSTSSPTSQPTLAQSPPSSTAIDPALSTSQPTSSTPAHVSSYSTSTHLSQTQPFSHAGSYPFSHVSPASLSISSHIPAEQSFQHHHQVQVSQQTHEPSPLAHSVQPSVQTTISPYAMHAPSAIMPSQFFNSTPTPSTPTPPVSTPTSVTTVNPAAVTSTETLSESHREAFRIKIVTMLQPNSFSGAQGVKALVAQIMDFGISEVDAITRLEIVNKTLQNAGNHYYRAWMENVNAMDITRDWLKATVSSKADSQILETSMPLLTLLDRIPFTGEFLKASKVGKLVARLAKTASNAAVKDMASNVERKWREKFLGHVEPMDVEQDAQGKKRKLSDRDRDSTLTSKSIPPKKKAAVTSQGPKTVQPSSISVSVKREVVAKSNVVVTAGVKDSKSDSSFFSAPKPKPKLPTFKKAPAPVVKKEDTANVAQPSSENPFQQALKEMEKSRQRVPGVSAVTSSNSGSAVPVFASTPGPAVTAASVTKLGKPKKRVTWMPDADLEKVKYIERAQYDDDPVDGMHVHSNLRDLDKGEGAALHHAADAFEELVDWTEPLVLELPIEIADRVRGENSEEKNVQERREESALRAMYLSQEEVPESPAEPASQIPIDQVDASVRIMLPGSDVEAFVFEQHHQPPQPEQPPSLQQNGTGPSVADLIGQLNGGTPAANPIAGIDLKSLEADPGVATQVSPAQLQQLMQLLGASTATQQASYGVEPASAPIWQTPPVGPAGAQAWTDQNGRFGQETSQPAPLAQPFGRAGGDDSIPDGPRWDGAHGGHGPRAGWRGGPRGRGRGRGGKSRIPCSFFAQGRCKYGDQCDFSHEISYN